MLDNVLQYVFFFGAVAEIYFVTAHKYRWFLLLIASYLLYIFWAPSTAWVLVAITIISYGSGRAIDRSDRKKAKIIVAACISTIVMFMLVYKYMGFLTLSSNSFFRFFHMGYRAQYISFIQPVGLMFFSLKAISYVVDVYRRKMSAEKHFGYYALYIAFFPQIVAGPIERAATMISQFKVVHNFNYGKASEGAFLIAYGFFKKMVIADRLDIAVSSVYNTPYIYTGYQLIIATLLFAIQIYCDFSGYSDIAIGSAKLLGFETGPNFNDPYLATSVRDFWNRWHISFSSWLKDYIYIPLGGNRVSKFRSSINIGITFFVSGLWHGANWTFIVWGLLHASYMIIAQYLGKYLPRWAKKNIFAVPATFIMVSVAWIFFRANTVGEGWYIVTHLFSSLDTRTISLLPIGYIIEDHDLMFLRYMLLSFILIQIGLRWHKGISNAPPLLRWTIYYVLVLTVMTVFYIYGGGVRQFIYATF